MSNYILTSNQSSVVATALEKSGVQDLSYELQPSYPNLVKDPLELQPIQSLPATSFLTQTSRFDLPRANFLYDLVLKTNFTITNPTAGDGGFTIDSANLYGLTIIEYVELRSRGRVICTVTGDDLRNRQLVSGTAKALAISRRAFLSDPTTGLNVGDIAAAGSDAVTVHTHIGLAFFEKIESNLDLGWIEQMQIVVKYNSAQDAGLPSLATYSACSNSLWQWTWQPELKYYNQIRAKDFARATPVNRLIYSTETERTVCTSTTSNQAEIKVNYPVFCTYVNLYNNAANTFVSPVQINSMDFAFTGRKVYESMPRLIAQWEQESSGNSQIQCTSDTAIARPSLGNIAMFWGMDPNDRSYNSGCISFNQINKPIITLYHATITAANTQIFVTHEFWAMLEIDGKNGKVVTSTAT